MRPGLEINLTIGMLGCLKHKYPRFSDEIDEAVMELIRVDRMHRGMLLTDGNKKG